MKNIIEILVVSVPVAGAIAVLISTYIMRKQLQVQAYQSIQQILCTINKCFIEFPELRKYFNESKPLPDVENPDFDRASCMIEMLMDFYDLVYEQRIGMSKRQWNGWRNNIKLVYRSSPGLKNHVLTQGDRYSHGLIELFNNRDS